MQNLMNVQDLTINSDNGIDSQRLLNMVNETRKEYGEPPIRNNKFIEKIIDELEGGDLHKKGRSKKRRLY